MPDLKAQSDTPATPGDNAPAGRGADPLAGLYKMSTTAGVGSQDYVAINGTSIGALLLGFASVLVVLGDILLVIPLAGIFCAWAAMRQIRDSNGTQTGRAFAAIGLALALALGAARVGWDLYTKLHRDSDQQQITALMKALGDDLSAGHYDEAYARFSDRFKRRVNRASFEAQIKGMQSALEVGALRGIDWNHEPMYFEEQPDLVVANAMALVSFNGMTEPSRQVMQFEKRRGQWKVDDIPSFFGTRRKKGAAAR